MTITYSSQDVAAHYKTLNYSQIAIITEIKFQYYPCLPLERLNKIQYFAILIVQDKKAGKSDINMKWLYAHFHGVTASSVLG